MKAAASTTSFAAVRDGRGIWDRRGSIFPWRMISCRIFGAERIASVMDRIGMEEGQPIEHRLISKAIENAQKRVEGQNFDIRKHLLEYDDVMNRQRQVIYEQRKKVLKGEALWEDMEEMLEEMVEGIVPEYVDEKSHPEEWDLKGLDERIFRHFTLKLNLAEKGRDLTPGRSLKRRSSQK